MTGGVGDGLRLGIGGLHLWRSTSYNMGMEYGGHDGVLVVIHIFSPCSFPGQRKKEKEKKRKELAFKKRGGKKTDSQKL